MSAIKDFDLWVYMLAQTLSVKDLAVSTQLHTELPRGGRATIFVRDLEGNAREFILKWDEV
jgi:hypothetical protein